MASSSKVLLFSDLLLLPGPNTLSYIFRASSSSYQVLLFKRGSVPHEGMQTSWWIASSSHRRRSERKGNSPDSEILST